MEDKNGRNILGALLLQETEPVNAFFLLLILPLAGMAQLSETARDSLGQTVFSRASIYLICRGTTSKGGFIARQFNREDSLITHAGLGLLENDSLIVYHVSDAGRNDNALIRESICSFAAGEDTYYLSAWEYKTNRRKTGRLMKWINAAMQKRIVFDILFRADNGDTLYCSEFCVHMLEKTLPRIFHFQTEKKQLNSLYAALLKRKEIDYYPVDFFRSNKAFVLFREYYSR